MSAALEQHESRRKTALVSLGIALDECLPGASIVGPVRLEADLRVYVPNGEIRAMPVIICWQSPLPLPEVKLGPPPESVPPNPPGKLPFLPIRRGYTALRPGAIPAVGLLSFILGCLFVQAISYGASAGVTFGVGFLFAGVAVATLSYIAWAIDSGRPWQ